MTDPDACCLRLDGIKGGKSPFDHVIALGWSDGPTEGFVSCGRCRRDFHFEMVEEWLGGGGDDDIRVFRLDPLPEGSLASLEAALAAHQSPRRPVWLPIWEFSTAEARAEVDRTLNRLLDAGGPPRWVVATPNIVEIILEARGVTSQDIEEVDDWPGFLGFKKVAVAE